MSTRLLVVLLAAWAAQAAAGSSADCPPETRGQVAEAEDFLSGLADMGVLGATLGVYIGGCGLVLEKAYGYSVPELKLPMSPDVATPIGSNTKFFTAVALWQLAERGLIDMDAPVSQYMDPADFNQTEPWCPRVYGAAPDSPCTAPSAKQLLNMGSGLVDIDNCRYPDGSWQRDYCLPITNAVNLIKGPGGELDPELAMYHAPDGRAFFEAERYWDMPLEFEPGKGYQYVNANFQLAGYLIEKLSGETLLEYYRNHILGPANLTSVSMDLASGAQGIVPGTYPGGDGYRVIVAPVSEEYVQGMTAGTTMDPSALTQVPIGQVASLARIDGVIAAMAWAGAAGAMQSTPADMVKWWHTFLFEPEVLNLTAATVKEMLTSTNAYETKPGIPPSEAAFAQGIIVMPNASYAHGVKGILYIGSINLVDSPYSLTFLTTDPQGPEDTAMLGGTFFARPELGVPFANDTSCDAESPWPGQGSGEIGPELCQMLQVGPRDYVTRTLLDIFDIDSLVAPKF